jgi:hypothetical protein
MGLFSKKTLSIDFGNKYLKFAVGEYKNNHLVIDMKYKAKNNMSHLVYVHNSKVYDN